MASLRARDMCLTHIRPVPSVSICLNVFKTSSGEDVSDEGVTSCMNSGNVTTLLPPPSIMLRISAKAEPFTSNPAA